MCQQTLLSQTTQGLKTQVTSSRISASAFPLTHWNESRKVFATTSERYSFTVTTEVWTVLCVRVCATVFVCRAAGGGGQPNTLHSLTRRLWSLSVLLLFLNTDPYLPTAQELSRLTSVMLTQAWIKSSLFTPQLRLYWSMFLCWETGCCFISPTSKP